MARRLTSTFLIAGLAVFVAGCGGGGDAATDAGGVAPAPTDTSTSQPVSSTTTPTTPGATDPLTGAPTAPAGGGGGIPMTSANAGDLPTMSGTANDVFTESFKLESSFDVQTGKTSDDALLSAADMPSGSTGGAGDECKTVETVTYTSAKITLDGASYSVKKGSTFPKDTQQFTVTSISEGTAVVNLTAGEFSDGSDGITLTTGDPVTLVNQSEGITYTLELTKVVGSKSSSDTNTSVTDAVC